MNKKKVAVGGAVVLGLLVGGPFMALGVLLVGKLFYRGLDKKKNKEMTK